jgi:hypothetical protein
MSKWRQKAIEILPKCKREFEHRDASIYTVFFELLPATHEAHKIKDKDSLKKYYDFAEWCFRQKEKDLRNAAGVAFYEHLGDDEITLKEFPQWVKHDIYSEVRELLEMMISKEKLEKADLYYAARPTIKKKKTS